jgi:Flp pilus assembly protein TadD
MNVSIGRVAMAGWLAFMAIGAQGGVAMAQPVSTAPPATEHADAPTPEEARALMQAGRFDEAAETWRRIAEADPESGTAWFFLGYCLHAAGRLDEAVEMHKKAATFEDYHGIALYNLACARALLGRTDDAFEALAASQAAGFTLRGRAEQDSDFDSIREDPRFHALLEKEPAGWRGKLQQAFVQLRGFVQQSAPEAQRKVMGFLQGAAARGRGLLAGLSEKLAQDERFAGIARKLQGWLGQGSGPGAPGEAAEAPSLARLLQEAQRHQRTGNWEAAVASFRKAIEVDPESAPAWFGLAYSLHASGDYENAIEAHRKAATFEQIKGIALYNLACAYALTSETDKAIEALAASKKAGFDVADAAASDPDLDSLRDDPRFVMLITGGSL